MVGHFFGKVSNVTIETCTRENMQDMRENPYLTYDPRVSIA